MSKPARWQHELLELAFEASEAIPVEPHLADRSRAQTEVVVACLAVGDCANAVAFADRIVNWRRGLGFADCAYFCAEHGRISDAEVLIDRAELEARLAEGWRAGRIRGRMAETLVLLGKADEARALVAGIEGGKRGSVDAELLRTMSDEEIEAWFDRLNVSVEQAAFDAVHGGVTAVVELFDRFYADTERRDDIERRLGLAWKPLPVIVRLDVVESLARVAAEHGDSTKVQELAGRLETMTEESRFAAAETVKLIARRAALRAQGGDPVMARQELAEATALYDAQAERISTVYRAGVLRTIAESCSLAGEHELATEMYDRAIAVGADNVNSRPVALDLVSNCCSLATCGTQPKSVVVERLHAIRDGLGREQW